MDPLTPEEMADEIKRQEYMRQQARALASQSLSSQAPPPEAMPAQAPPPATPSAADPAAARSAAAAELMGPLGKAVFGHRAPPADAAKVPATAPSAEGGAPQEPAPGPGALNGEKDAIPTLSPSVTAARMVSPAGMYPESMAATVHQGKPVPQAAKDAYSSANEARLAGAQKERDAEKEYYKGVVDTQVARETAYEDASRSRARIQAERQQLVQKKLAEVDALNKEASAAIDPDKAWGGLGGRIVGALAMGLGAAGAALTGTQNWGQQAVMATVNARIDAMKAERAGKRAQAQGALNLVDVYRQKFGDDEKAVDDALRLYLLKNVDGQLDRLAAQRGVDRADAKYLQIKGDLASMQGDIQNRMALQEEDDITKQATQRWHNASYAGGGLTAPGSKDENVVRVPGFKDSESPTFVKVPKEARHDLEKQWGIAQQYAQMNNDALNVRKEIRSVGVPSSPDEVSKLNRLYATLKQLNADQATLRARVKDPATGVRESEVTREIKQGIDYTSGMLPGAKLITGDVDKRIGDSTSRVFAQADAMTRGVVGEKVQPVKVQLRDGSWDIRYRGVGEIYTGRSAPVVGEQAK